MGRLQSHRRPSVFVAPPCGRARRAAKVAADTYRAPTSPFRRVKGYREQAPAARRRVGARDRRRTRAARPWLSQPKGLPPNNLATDGSADLGRLIQKPQRCYAEDPNRLIRHGGPPPKCNGDRDIVPAAGGGGDVLGFFNGGQRSGDVLLPDGDPRDGDRVLLRDRHRARRHHRPDPVREVHRTRSWPGGVRLLHRCRPHDRCRSGRAGAGA
jgi:hypothetical protein